MGGNNELLVEGKSERLKQILTNPFAEENILWFTLIIWCIVEIILRLVYHSTLFYKVGYAFWNVFAYAFVPFWITKKISSKYFDQNSLSSSNLWKGEDSAAETKFIIVSVGYITLMFFVINFLPQFTVPFIIFGIIIVLLAYFMKAYPRIHYEENFLNYFTRLEKRQVLWLLFTFILLPGIGLLFPEGGIFIGYLLIFLFTAFMVIFGNMKTQEIGIRFFNLLIIIIVILLPVMGRYIEWIADILFFSISPPNTQSFIEASYKFLIVGYGEELLYRVLLQTYLERKIGGHKAVVTTSLIFTMLHIPIFIGYDFFGFMVSLLSILQLGLILGYIWLKTRSLPVIAISHSLKDIVGSLYGGG